MHILQSITDIFNWLESTGILAALGAFVLVVIKQVQPYLKTHIKERQMAQLTDFALATVTKFAQLASLSKSDRKKQHFKMPPILQSKWDSHGQPLN
ncbi:MAG: hypothetical protein SOH70_03755 [Lentilactobacillus sunkii]|jgi:hypothetical protein|uniref:hypothetical protein n=1 Tax=Lentilactobacillus sunkii TaxID=481719 RepID=UPI002F35CC1E